MLYYNYLYVFLKNIFICKTYLCIYIVYVNTYIYNVRV
jgi:hypothetical protein